MTEEEKVFAAYIAAHHIAVARNLRNKNVSADDVADYALEVNRDVINAMYAQMTPEQGEIFERVLIEAADALHRALGHDGEP